MCGPNECHEDHQTSFSPDALAVTHLLDVAPRQLTEIVSDTSTGVQFPTQPSDLTDRLGDVVTERRSFLKGLGVATASLVMGNSIASQPNAGVTDPGVSSTKQDRVISVGAETTGEIPTFFINEIEPSLIVEKAGIKRRARQTAMDLSKLTGKPRLRASLHNHASESEVRGSYRNHAAKAIAKGFDLLVITGHRFRMDAIDESRFLRNFTFDTLSRIDWTWKPTFSGTGLSQLTDASIGSTDRADGTTINALRLHAGSTTSSSAGVNLTTQQNTFNGPIEGRSINLSVTNQKLVGNNSRLEMQLALSNTGKNR